VHASASDCKIVKVVGKKQLMSAILSLEDKTIIRIIGIVLLVIFHALSTKMPKEQLEDVAKADMKTIPGNIVHNF
jgi:hypothetical protein